MMTNWVSDAKKIDRLTSICPVLSTLTLLATYAALFFLLDRYDWGQPFVRFACLASLLAVCLLTRRTRWHICPRMIALADSSWCWP